MEEKEQVDVEEIKRQAVSDHIKERSRKGGLAIKAKRGPDYFKKLGQKGGRKRWDKEKQK